MQQHTIKSGRHGDLFIEIVTSKSEIDALKKAASKMRKVENGLIIVGEGLDHGHFATGDTEVFLEKDINNAEMPVIGAIFVGEDGKLQHLNTNSLTWTQEHKDIVLPPNSTFRITRQRTFDATSELTQFVAD